jgi:hypothetical protein
MGMQQGFSFYQRLLLLKILEIFNSGVFHERTVFYTLKVGGPGCNSVKT